MTFSNRLPATSPTITPKTWTTWQKLAFGSSLPTATIRTVSVLFNGGWRSTWPVKMGAC